jgi:hypothetical protein
MDQAVDRGQNKGLENGDRLFKSKRMPITGSATRYTTHLSSTDLSTVLFDPLLLW